MPLLQQAAPDKAEFANKRFLIVDDFDGMRKLLRDLLRRCGAHQIDVAGNGNEALTAISRNKYDIVLCDYYLGAGKNGQQILEEARHKSLIGTSTIWVMITAEKTSDMVMGAVEHQPDDYLIKPVTEAMLQMRLSRLAAKKAALGEIEAAVRAKEYLKAITLCEQRMSQEKGGDVGLVKQRCDLLMLVGKFEEARAAYEKQLAIRDAPWAKAGLAKLHFREGKYLKARDLLQQVLDDNRNFLEGYDWLAKTQGCLGDWQDAETLLQRAITLSPNSVQRQQSLGEAAGHNNNLELAEQAYNKALSLGNNSDIKTPQPYLGLAKVYTEKGQKKEALAVLARLAQDVEGDTARLQAKAAEVRVLHKSGDTAEAQKLAQELSAQIQGGAHDMPPAVTLELAEAFMEIGDKEVGSQLLQFVVRNHYEDEALTRRAQDVYGKAGMGDEGAAIIDATRARSVEIMDQGVRLSSQGKIEEGIEVLQEARLLMPNNPRLLLNLAYLHIKQMEKTGWHHAKANEARKLILIARRYAIDDQRCGQLLAKLETLA
ncbi:MAG: response regulator [Burkholderiales bacterium]|nr:response regulator [Burkholderiales bacterium]